MLPFTIEVSQVDYILLTFFVKIYLSDYNHKPQLKQSYIYAVVGYKLCICIHIHDTSYF